MTPPSAGRPPTAGAGAPDGGASETGASDAGGPGADQAAARFSGRVRPASRSANRAAKRAASGRPPAGVPRPARRRSSSTGPLLALAAVGAAVVLAVIAFGNPFGGGGPDPSEGPGGSGAAGDCPTTQPPALPAGESRLVTISTDLGDIEIRVDGALSPIAAGNFVALAECGFYDGVVFHRTAALQDGTPFVIQGGDPDGDGSGGPGYFIQDEPVTASYRRGTVAMARTDSPNSQGSQFFIVLDDDAVAPLEQRRTYAIFGEVVSGMEVADAILEASDGVELPPDPIVMNSVTVEDVPAASGSPSSAAPSTGSPAPSGAAPAS